jgi:selenocysteine lyase/cysteine desulfurase
MSLLRDVFQVPEGIYLLNHSVGALPRAAEERAARFFELWRTRGGGAWEGWLEEVEGFRRALAALLGGAVRDYCPQTNISTAVARLLPALPARPGRKRVLLSELDFPSVGFAVTQAQRLGYEVVFLEADAHRTFPLEAWERALTEDTQLVLMTHSLYGNSYLNPVEQVLPLARERGIFTLVDVAQSAGVVPIHVEAWGADLVVGSCVKWLCGGPGAGYLWVNPEVAERLSPVDVGWFSHENPFEFDIRRFRYAPGALRFWGGTPSVLPYMVATAGLEALRALGVEKVRAHNQALTERLLAGALERGLRVSTPLEPSRRGGTAVIQFPQPEQAVRHLQGHGIAVDQRPGFGVRFSPHAYNTEVEVDTVLSLLPS